MIWERLIDFGANWNGVDSLAWLGFSATRATTMHAYNGSGAGARDFGLRDGWDVHFAFFSLLFPFLLLLIFYLLTGLAWLTLAVCAREVGREEREKENGFDESTYIRIYATARRINGPPRVCVHANARGRISYD